MLRNETYFRNVCEEVAEVKSARTKTIEVSDLRQILNQFMVCNQNSVDMFVEVLTSGERTELNILINKMREHAQRTFQASVTS